MKFAHLLFSLFLIGCSGGDDSKPGYIEFNSVSSDGYETCDNNECGTYPELMKCGDGSFPKEMRCVFVPDFGCKWIIFECFEG